MKPGNYLVALALAFVMAASAEAQAPVHVPEGAPARVHALPTLREQAAEEEAYLDVEGERHWMFRRKATFHIVW